MLVIFHPRYKYDVDYRLSRSGLAVAYQQQVESHGPIVQRIVYSIDSKIMNITYTVVLDIELRNPNGFKICCQGTKCSNDTLWFPATVSSKNGSTITLTLSSSWVGQQLYGLHNHWRDTPYTFKQAAIYSYTYPNLHRI